MDFKAKLSGALVIILIVLAFFPPSLAQSITSSTSQALIPFTGTLNRSFSALNQSVGVRTDFGAQSLGFTQTHLSWASPLNNFTSSLPSITGATLSLVTSQNSTTVDWHETGTLGLDTVTLDQFSNAKGYNQLVIITGSISGLVGTVPLTVSFGTTTSICDTANTPFPCTQVCNNNLCYDWSADSGFSPSYNNVTKVLTFLVGSSFTLLPLALDGSSNCSVASTNTCTTGTITTASSPDVLVAVIGISNGQTVSTVTSTPALTWTLRQAILLPSSSNAGSNQCGSAGRCDLETWYATDSGTFSGTVKVTSTGGATCCMVQIQGAFGVAGADTVNIFDNHAGVPCSSALTSSSPQCNLTTNNPGFFFGAAAFSVGTNACSVILGFVSIANTCSGPISRLAVASDYVITPVAETTFATGYSAPACGAANTCAIIGDVIIPAAPVTTTSTTTTTVFESQPGNSYLWLMAIPLTMILFIAIVSKRRR